MFEWINLFSFIISMFLWSYLYLISVQPMKRQEKFGEKAWRDCKRLRIIAAVFMIIGTANMFLWLIVPIQVLNWPIHPNPIVGIIIGIAICVIFLPFVIKGEIDAGKETMAPSKETKMYGGIYKYIRHPQTLGEWPLFIAFSAFINSWFFVILSVLYIVIYTPIMVYYEEIDLEKRFGEPYKKYKETTGAFFPKLKKKKRSES
jgi:protein-S-isoprenylcysteine O-methyltransferase Ste14